MDDASSPKRLCLHCESNVPYRTYMNHKKRYYNDDTGEWQKDPSLDISSDEEILNFESSDSDIQDTETADLLNETWPANRDDYLEVEQLAPSEIWDEELLNDIENDLIEGSSSEYVSMLVESENSEKQSVILQWLLIGIFHLWSTFRVPDTAIDFPSHF